MWKIKQNRALNILFVYKQVLIWQCGGGTDQFILDYNLKLYVDINLFSSYLHELDETFPNRNSANTCNSKQPRKESSILESCSDKLNLSRSQQMRREKTTLIAAVRSVHCVTNTRTNHSDSKSVNEGLWTTLLGTASTSQMKAYSSQSKVYTEKALPEIVKDKFKE